MIENFKDIPKSFVELLRLFGEDDYINFGNYTFPNLVAGILDATLTFFVLYFLAKWIFDILISISKGGKF